MPSCSWWRNYKVMQTKRRRHKTRLTQECCGISQGVVPLALLRYAKNKQSLITLIAQIRLLL